MLIGSRLKELRRQNFLTLEEMAKLLDTTPQSINKYEKGVVKNIPLDKLEKLASILHCPPSYLVGWTNKAPQNQPLPNNSVQIPVLGEVAAGVPIFANENRIGTVEIPKELAATGVFFGLKIKGDSMTPQIMDGDIVIVKHQDYADNNNVVIALIDGENATCKRLMKTETGIALISFNPNYTPRMFSKKEVMQNKVAIIGKVVEVRREII